MLEKLLTEQTNPASASIDTLPTADVLRIINAEDRTVAEAVAREIPAIALAVDAIVAVFQAGGRLFYIGAGTSGRLGVLDAAECPPTFSVSPEMVQGIIAGGEPALSRATEASEDDPATGARDLLARGFTGRDLLVTVGISCTPGSELTGAVDIAITPLTGPEVVAGSTRMKAGTAQKLVLNMLTTAAMIRLGYVYGNLMVNVQPKNAKLMDRARRIVVQAAGVSLERAQELLDQAGNNVRVAILIAKSSVGREEAERRLAAAGGSIAKALNG
jgi:N-acetylmuramic acid 6-phosphate etherase